MANVSEKTVTYITSSENKLYKQYVKMMAVV